MAHGEKADGLQKPDKETSYIFNHMMLKLKIQKIMKFIQK